MTRTCHIHRPQTNQSQPVGGDTKRKQSHERKNTIKVKQPASVPHLVQKAINVDVMLPG